MIKASGTQLPRQAYDVFNGDADGICALHQLRLVSPRDAILVTGVKRDIALLQRVPVEKDLDITVLDVSLDVNVDALKQVLEAGSRVSYFDHHAAQLAFEHPQLQLHWNDSPDVCTSILVDRHLQGRYRRWAITAAFGDNLLAVARTHAGEIDLSESDTYALEELGSMLNYNAYGESIEDLHIAPEALYQALHQFTEPLDFIADAPQYRLLREGYRADESRMADLTPYWQSSACGAIYVLPNAPWARRVSGVFANKLTAANQECAFAVLTEKADGAYVVSVRSGAPAARSANGLCGEFASGGGRRLAAGINNLPASELDRFISRFSEYFSAPSVAAPGGKAHEH